MADTLVGAWLGDVPADSDGDILPPEPSVADQSSSGVASPNAGPVKHPLPQHSTTAPICLDAIVSCPHTGLPVATPFRPAAWQRLLARHRQPAWAHRLVHDLIHGVDIGYRGVRQQRRGCPNFVPTAGEEEAVVADLAKETALGHVAGPFATSPFPAYICSPLKTVPKKGNAAKLRIIHHLSFPHGRSVNSDTADWPCPLQGFNCAVRIVHKLGRGCFMAKVDVRAAYRCIPVRPADWPLLGMLWRGQYYFHRTLPFGLRSACHLWERYANAFEWIVKSEFGVQDTTHYVDDTFLASASEAGCSDSIARTKAAGVELGVPDAADKTEGPTTSLTYLGIRIDSVAMSISLDNQRITDISQLLREWAGRTSCSLRQLQSLIGILSWAAQVVRHGRTFLQHLRDVAATHVNTRGSQAIPLTQHAHEDIGCST